MKNCLALLIAAAFISLASAPGDAGTLQGPATSPAAPATSSIGGGVSNPWRAPGRTALSDLPATLVRFIS